MYGLCLFGYQAPRALWRTRLKKSSFSRSPPLHVCFPPSIIHRMEMAYLDKFLHLSIISAASSSISLT